MAAHGARALQATAACRLAGNGAAWPVPRKVVPSPPPNITPALSRPSPLNRAGGVNTKLPLGYHAVMAPALGFVTPVTASRGTAALLMSLLVSSCPAVGAKLTPHWAA